MGHPRGFLAVAAHAPDLEFDEIEFAGHQPLEAVAVVRDIVREGGRFEHPPGQHLGRDVGTARDRPVDGEDSPLGVEHRNRQVGIELVEARSERGRRRREVWIVGEVAGHGRHQPPAYRDRGNRVLGRGAEHGDVVAELERERLVGIGVGTIRRVAGERDHPAANPGRFHRHREQTQHRVAIQMLTKLRPSLLKQQILGHVGQSQDTASPWYPEIEPRPPERRRAEIVDRRGQRRDVRRARMIERDELGGTRLVEARNDTQVADEFGPTTSHE